MTVLKRTFHSILAYLEAGALHLGQLVNVLPESATVAADYYAQMVLDGNAQGGLIGNLQAGVGWVTGALVSPVTDDNFTMTMMMIAAMGVLGGALKGVTLGRLATTVLQRAGSVVLGGFGLSNLASWWNNPAQTTSDVKQGSGNLNAAFTMLAGALILFSPMLFKPNSKALGPVLDGTVVSGTTASQVVNPKGWTNYRTLRF